jgi:hypothetical protein
MLTVQVDAQEVEQIFLNEVKKRLDQLESQQVFWDMKTLCKVTNMSDNFIKEQFFYEKDFPKYRVGKKWLFPAKETEQFLIRWLKQHPQS